ncbi:TIGR04013 family B12-binding domain/radical SAM domain-containing protein [Methanocella conradii]|uniref:TIGR04013 family B12-binding domain/radical SAM domain-containing protein n=1 Tax=Methanocella conradii TaxID=1175444 RepID=UPI00157CBC63|nr:TIGR04013 family B12-binding domain/radical SAM domain-containing protein [Methanocella conradii]
MHRVSFRWNPKNRYSIAALRAVLDFGLVRQPVDGIMLYSFASPQARQVYAEVDAANTNTIFIAGGPHPSGCPEEALEHFDYVVIGEGEETLPELVAAISEGRDVSSVKGIAFKERGKVVFTGRRDEADLDRYPPFKPPLFGPIEITRGCPWGCAYCQTPGLFGRHMRHRSVEAICKYDKYYEDKRFVSPNAFAYGSNGITPNIEAVEKLLRSLSGNVYFGTFPSEVRPEFVTARMLELVNAYCANKELHLGGQSGSDRMLRAIHRGHSAADIMIAVERTRDAGLTPVVDFIFGLPGEREEDQRLTLELISSIVKEGGKVRAHRFMPLPGTELANARPEPLSPEVEKLLGKLALEEKLTGSWSGRQ